MQDFDIGFVCGVEARGIHKNYVPSTLVIPESDGSDLVCG